MKIKANYSFDASEKKITFTDYNPVSLNSILLITNVTDNVIIYNFADPLKGGTAATNVLTLTYDTTAMADDDKLLVYYDDPTKDGVQVETIPTDSSKKNPSLALTWTSGQLVTLVKTIAGVTYTKTLTWTSGQLTAVSGWV